MAQVIITSFFADGNNGDSDDDDKNGDIATIVRKRNNHW